MPDICGKADRKKVKTITLMVHGVRSHGTGFERLANYLKDSNDFPVETHRLKLYSYEKIMALSAMMPGTKKLISDSVGYYINRQTTDFGGEPKYPNLDKINVVAHSLGSYGSCRYIKQAPEDEVNIDNLILVGSVVNRDYPWSRIIHEENKVNEVTNVISSWDVVPDLALLAGLGNSGSAWFKSNPGFHDTAYKDGRDYVENLVWDGMHTSYSNPSWSYALGYLLKEKCTHSC